MADGDVDFLLFCPDHKVPSVPAGSECGLRGGSAPQCNSKVVAGLKTTCLYQIGLLEQIVLPSYFSFLGEEMK